MSRTWHNPMRPTVTKVVVEYDVELRSGNGGAWIKIVRRRREFCCNGKARAFYHLKLRAGKNPRVVGVELNEQAS